MAGRVGPGRRGGAGVKGPGGGGVASRVELGGEVLWQAGWWGGGPRGFAGRLVLYSSRERSYSLKECM